MRKYLIIFLMLLFTGCAPSQEEEQFLAKVNNYIVTKNEFEEAFKDSPYVRDNTIESRKEFLDNLINRKLILQDAQEKGLDKNKDFLKMIERFWEQSLFRLALEKKTNEIAGTAFVSDAEIEKTYRNMLKEGKTDKSYEQMYSQIKWELAKLKESRLLNEWIDNLRKNSDIKINHNLLKKVE